MGTRNQRPKESEEVNDTKSESVAPYDLLYITRAYNRREITFEEWLRLAKEWAEQMIRQYGKAE